MFINVFLLVLFLSYLLLETSDVLSTLQSERIHIIFVKYLYTKCCTLSIIISFIFVFLK